MGFLRNRAVSRVPVVGAFSDLAVVGAALSRLAQRRRGAVDTASSPLSAPELLLALAAAFRLIQRLRASRQRRRAARLASA